MSRISSTDSTTGRPLLVHHVSLQAFADNPRWRSTCGGAWVEGTSYHPPIGEGVWSPVPGAHPVVESLGDLHVLDERYTDLVVDPGVTVLLTQHEAGEDHPTAWVNEVGGVRVVYDSLGHDVRSMANPQRRELLRREVAWLLGR